MMASLDLWNRGRRRRRCMLALLVAVVLTAGACGGNGGGDGGGEGRAGAGPADVATVKLAFVPLASMLPVWVAEEQGYFRDHAIELADVPGAEESPVGVPLVMSGQADVALITPAGLIQAAQEGLPLRAVVGLTRVGETEERDDSGLVVRADSPVKDLADLTGTKVALSSLNSSPQWTLMAAIDDAGGDSSSVEYIQSPLPAMQGLLESGEVDAAAIPDPLLPGALAGGRLRLLARPNHLVHPGRPALLLFGSREWIDGNSETVGRFQAAVEDAVAFLEDPANKQEVQAILAERTEIPEQFVGEVHLNEFSTELREEDLAAALEFMGRYGGPQAEVDLAALLPPDGR